MSLAFRNEIAITVWLARGTIADVAILPRSRPPLTRLFAGKPAPSLSMALPRLFSLCSIAHQVAFLSAVEAAQGRDVPPATMRRRVTALVAERLTELLRGLFVGRLSLDGASAAAVRATMQASKVLGGAMGEDGTLASRREAVSQIRTALRALGIAGEDHAPAPGSALGAYIASLDGEVLLSTRVARSFLSAADDPEIVIRLLAGGATFSDAPELRGQIPETGVWARKVSRAPMPASGADAVERLKARLVEVACLFAWLEGAEPSIDGGIVESYRLGAGKGAAAVECARGRLYHAVELDDGDRILRFESLAPTEWNFHARGPLVQSLRGASLRVGRQGQDAVRTLIGSFDPCVGFSLSFREVGHA